MGKFREFVRSVANRREQVEQVINASHPASEGVIEPVWIGPRRHGADVRDWAHAVVGKAETGRYTPGLCVATPYQEPRLIWGGVQESKGAAKTAAQEIVEHWHKDLASLEYKPRGGHEIEVDL